MEQNCNQKRDSVLPKNVIPIPQEEVNLLEKGTCNFSLYSPRMVAWERDGSELKPDTEIIHCLAKAFNSKRLKEFLFQKQNQQSTYIKSLEESGIQAFTIKAKTTSPFITGLGAGHPTETGMILDRNIGVPYIPASSIKGVLRLAHAINIANGRKEVPDSELEKYFGTTDTKQEKQYRGQLVVLDAYPVGEVQLKVDIMNPHYTKYYDGTNKKPVETESPNPIKFLAVQEGTEFVFNCAFMPLQPEDKCDEKEIYAMFETAFEVVGFGGKTAIGYGRFKRKSDRVQKPVVVSKQAAPVQKRLEPGEYEAIVVGYNKSGKNINGILFRIDSPSGSYTAIKDKGCKTGDNTRYPKQTKVKVRLSGEKSKSEEYLVTEIIEKIP